MIELDEASRRWERALIARAAMLGVNVRRTATGWSVARWGLVRELPSLVELSAWLDQVGGRTS